MRTAQTAQQLQDSQKENDQSHKLMRILGKVFLVLVADSINSETEGSDHCENGLKEKKNTREALCWKTFILQPGGVD
jgi:hypothetical protein